MKHAFISVRDSDKPRAVGIAKQLIDLGFKILATDGTFKVISEAGLECERVNKVTEGRPNIVDRIKTVKSTLSLIRLKAKGTRRLILDPSFSTSR